MLFLFVSLAAAAACGGGSGGDGDGGFDDDELQLVFTDDNGDGDGDGDGGNGDGNDSGPADGGTSPGLLPTDTPTPAATPEPTVDPLRQMVEESLQTQTAARFPPTPTPTPEPEFVPPTRAPIPTATLRPTPTPTRPPPPTPWAKAPATPEPSEAAEHSCASYRLTVAPGSPFTGDKVRFEVLGLPPYSGLEASFTMPEGSVWHWVDRGEILTGVEYRKFAADGSGAVLFEQNGTPAQRGGWQVNVRFDDGQSCSITYISQEMFLEGLDDKALADFRFKGYNGVEARIYLSGDVPLFFAPALQDRISAVRAVLEHTLGPNPGYDPTVYLVDDPQSLDRLLDHLGYHSRNWEKGFYSPLEQPPAIFAVGEDFLSEVGYRTAHQYADGYIRRFSGGGFVPAWFREGLAEYFAYESGLGSDHRDATVYRLLREIDYVESMAEFGSLPSLRRLSQGARWSRTDPRDDVLRQYSYAHLLVRYLVVKEGESSLLRILESISQGRSDEEAVYEVTGWLYPDLEAAFVAWIAGWDFPELAEAEAYFEVLSAVEAMDDAVESTRGAALLLPAEARAGAWDGLISGIEEIVQRLEQIDSEGVPPELTDLHGVVKGYFEQRQIFLERERDALRGDFDRSDVDALSPGIDYRRAHWRWLEREYRCVLRLLRCGV